MENTENTRLTAFICYKDTNKMVEWLQQALGFEVTLDIKDESSGVTNHAELKLGNAVVMVQADAEGYDVPAAKGRSVGQGLYLMVNNKENVDALYARAVEQGTQVLVEPEETEWGNYHVELLDPEGRQWSIGTYMPGMPIETSW